MVSIMGFMLPCVKCNTKFKVVTIEDTFRCPHCSKLYYLDYSISNKKRFIIDLKYPIKKVIAVRGIHNKW